MASNEVSSSSSSASSASTAGTMLAQNVANQSRFSNSVRFFTIFFLLNCPHPILQSIIDEYEF